MVKNLTIITSTGSARLIEINLRISSQHTQSLSPCLFFSYSAFVLYISISLLEFCSIETGNDRTETKACWFFSCLFPYSFKILEIRTDNTERIGERLGLSPWYFVPLCFLGSLLISLSLSSPKSIFYNYSSPLYSSLTKPPI